MKKRFQSIDSMIDISVIVPLHPAQQEKFECIDLRHRIDTIAKDMQVDWAIETSDNSCVVAISRTYGPVVGEEEICKIEEDATRFMLAINKLEHEKPIPTQEVQRNDEYEFIKKIVDEWEETETRNPTIGFDVIMAVNFFGEKIPLKCGTISEPLAKELCMSYLKVHSND